MKVIITEQRGNFYTRRLLEVEDEDLIKRLLDLFLNPDVDQSENYIYEEGEIYYFIEYYFMNGFKEIKFRVQDLPEDREFLLDLLFYSAVPDNPEKL